MRPALRHALLAALVLALLGGAFLACFERRTIELPVGSSAEARANPYLALARVLERMGHDVTVVGGPGALDPLPPEDALLVLPTRRRTVTPARSEALWQWARRGGHLLLVAHGDAEDPARRPDPLLDRAGLRRIIVGEEAPEEEAQEPGAAEASSEGEPSSREATPGEDPAPSRDSEDELEWETAALALPGREEPLRARFLAHAVFEEPPPGAVVMRGDAGAHLVHTPLEAGRLTALSDARLLRNEHLAEEDHAELVLRLARGGGERAARPPRPPVWIVRGEEWPGLLAHAFEHARPALLAALALLAAWILRAVRRLGPLEPDPQPVRRSWLEHLEAAGALLWRGGAAATLRGAARRALEQRLRARRPAWLRLAPEARAERLGRLADLPAEAVRQALEEPAPPRRDRELIATIAHLERMRRSL